MASHPDTWFEQLSREQAARVDDACDAFERAWKAVATGGQPPDLRMLLTEFQDPQRSVLAHELIALDQAYRRRRGENPQPSDYQGLCADYDRQLAPGDPTRQRLPADSRESLNAVPRIESCEIVGVLGAGGMGIVYQARQPALDRYVAVKMLRCDGGADAERQRRFHQEARVVAQLQHPNLVQVYEIGEARDEDGTRPRPYFVLEYVRGGSLAQYLQGAPQPPREAAQLLETLARAVQHAHEHGVIHRDLKPGNVLLQTKDVRSAGGELTAAVVSLQ